MPTAIVVVGPSSELAIGGTVQLAASVLNASGAVMAGQSVQWTSLQPEIASVSPGGLVTALAAGAVTIRAASGSASGTLELTVRPAVCSAARAAGSIAFGQGTNGSLDGADCVLEHGGHAEGWSFTLNAPTTVLIEMNSSAFEAVILVTDRGMNVVGVGYAHSGSTRARFADHLPAGNYILWATSWEPGAFGAYSLTLGTATLCTTASTAGSITPGQTVTGALTAGSCLLPNMYPGQGWHFRVTAPTAVQVTMQANGFLPLLVATTMDLDPIAFGVPVDASGRVEFIQQFAPGDYVIWATSIDGGTGSYSIAVAEARVEPCPEPAPISLGGTVTGRLSGTSCRLPDGRFTEPWHFSVPTATALRIDMSSMQFDTFLILADSTGRVLAADDDGGGGTNSRMVVQVPAGSYTIHATSFALGETGAY